jgi:hypothetical protein
MNSIITENETILLTIPPFTQTSSQSICEIPQSEYLQFPVIICEQCFEQVTDIESHNLQKHEQTTIFCDHYTHGGKKIYFNNAFEKLQHTRVFHALSESNPRFEHSVGTVFPAIAQKASNIGIDATDSSLKRNISHLSYANFSSKKMKK